MTPLLIDLIAHAVWPIFVVAVCLIFRKPLGDLLSRLISFKAPGVELSSATPNASAQTNLVANAEGVKGADLSKALDITSITPNLELYRNYGSGIPTVHLQEDEIEKHLCQLGLTIHDETSRILMRQLAVSQCLLSAETTYRLIFGSQIASLKILNVFGEQRSEDLLEFYSTAKTLYGDAYGTYSGDQWLIFLVNQKLIVQNPDSGGYQITVWARDFLEWIVSAGVPEDKPY